LNLATELQQHWHEPGICSSLLLVFDPYPYHPSNYGQTYHNSQLHIDPTAGVNNPQSTTPTSNSTNGNSGGRLISVGPSGRVGSDGSGNGSGSGAVNGNSSNGSNVPTFFNEVHPGRGSGFTSTNGPIQDHTPFPNRQENLPFNNQTQISSWNPAVFGEVAKQDTSAVQIGSQSVHARPSR
jgi:hypothetical protein